MSVAKVLALPNLSHFVNATALVSDNERLIVIKIKYNNSNFNTAIIANTPHAIGCTYKRTQNTLESIGLMNLFGSADSKTQTFSKSLDPALRFVSFHHLNPTISLPEMFFKFQKSAETRRIRKMK